jgi:hypothetical protein
MLKRTFLSWLPFAILVTIIAVASYAAGQQIYRNMANDPQIQMAQDLAARLQAGPAAPSAPADAVDMVQSLAPFVMIFDDKGAPVNVSARINGRVPQPPAAVFASARTVPEQRLTWQPTTGIRAAIVIRHFAGAKPGFVIVGRSLREQEQRIGRLAALIRTAWAGSLVLLLVYFAIVSWWSVRQEAAVPAKVRK